MIHYITVWTKNDENKYEVYDDIYKDCFFTDRDEAIEYSNYLTKECKDGFEYEVFDGYVNKLRLPECYRGGKNDSM